MLLMVVKRKVRKFTVRHHPHPGADLVIQPAGAGLVLARAPVAGAGWPNADRRRAKRGDPDHSDVRDRRPGHARAHAARLSDECLLLSALRGSTRSTRPDSRAVSALVPWDPTRRLVVRGIYRHVRNPMITGVGAVLLDEAAVFALPARLAY